MQYYIAIDHRCRWSLDAAASSPPDGAGLALTVVRVAQAMAQPDTPIASSIAGGVPPVLVRALPCVFYGWVVAVVLAATQMVGHIGSVHLISLSIGRIYKTFEEDLQIPPEEAAVSWMAGCFLAAVFSPLYGRAIDVWGGKVCVPGALLIMACGNFLLPLATTRATAPLAFASAVFLLRSAAMGALSPYTNTILSQWFFRKRGLAISVVEMVSMTGTTFLVAQLWQHGLDTVGWRKTHELSGVCAALFAVPAGLLIYRTPESVGLRPDGDDLGLQKPCADAGSRKSAGCGEGGETRARAEGTEGYEDAEEETASLLGAKPQSASVDNGGDEDESNLSMYSDRKLPSQHNFTRAEACRTSALYMLAIDKMISTTVGVSCGQLLLLTLQENHAVGVNIATHVMIPTGASLARIAQTYSHGSLTQSLASMCG